MSELRYHPDYREIEGASSFIQWKGTSVCMDFKCQCGATAHVCGDSHCYALRCWKCKAVWLMPHSVGLKPAPEAWESEGRVVIDTEGKDDLTVTYPSPLWRLWIYRWGEA